MATECRVALRNVGHIDPRNIDDYIDHGGYQALKQVADIAQEKLIGELERSGRLRGRGGAGFNTGLKWRGAWQAEGPEKYIICNADEGEPGTYKDRIILENDPHTIIEGLAIGAYAIGADTAYIYCRGEYENALDIMREAIAVATQRKLLGGLTVHIVSGAGSYVCGEETALIESIEGKRGEPRLKPPYPTVAGLFGKPTVVNNVETFAAIPEIVLRGADWFSSLGAKKYPGTKIFCLSGDVVNRTWAEVSTDTTIRDIIDTFGGGAGGSGRIKAVQVGGSSCSFITVDRLDTNADFDSMSQIGASLGSGSVFVIDDSHNMVDILRPITRFFHHESCGKCTPCREGTMRMAELIEKIYTGDADETDVCALERLGRHMQTTSFCPLGQSASIPVLSALELFPEDFARCLEKKEGTPCKL